MFSYKDANLSTMNNWQVKLQYGEFVANRQIHQGFPLYGTYSFKISCGIAQV